MPSSTVSTTVWILHVCSAGAIEHIDSDFLMHPSQLIVDFAAFKNDLCEAFGANDDEKYLFHDVLAGQMKFPLQRRHRFYHILLFNFYRLEMSHLDTTNLASVLTTIFRRCVDNVDRDDVDYLLRTKNIDGKALQQLVNESTQSRDILELIKGLFDDLPNGIFSDKDWPYIRSFLIEWAAHTWAFDDDEEKESEHMYSPRARPQVLALPAQPATSQPPHDPKDEVDRESDDEEDLKEKVDEADSVRDDQKDDAKEAVPTCPVTIATNRIPRLDVYGEKDPFPVFIHKAVMLRFFLATILCVFVQK